MSHLRLRSASRRRIAALPTQDGESCSSTLALLTDVVLAERPTLPLHALRPTVATRAAERFLALFPGRVLYAVKCNPEPAVLKAMWAGGIRHFDCASAQEVRLVRQLFPTAEIHFMHPVKSRQAIREAWEQHRVRDFVLDSLEELEKIRTETRGQSHDLGLIVRLALPKGAAVHDLSGKFGAAPAEAAHLLRAARALVEQLGRGRVGLCFHVGSQCLDPDAWRKALRLAETVLEQAHVAIDVLDVGGGFPVSYPDVTPRPLDDFVAAITEGLAHMNANPAILLNNAEIWCEPGRALVAPSQSLVVRVESRRGDHLFINDGVYGSLSDAGAPGFRFPCRLIPASGAVPSGRWMPFSFYGPTCDSADRMNGPFMLSDDVSEGDWIEIGQVGAYGMCLRTAFNGFDQASLVQIADRPLLETPGY